MDDIVGQSLFVTLLLLSAFFVISEFAIVKMPASRLDELIKEGNKRALLAKKIKSESEGFVSLCQIGLALTALGLGWIGDSAIQIFLTGLANTEIPASLSYGIATFLAFITISFIYIVIGDLAPRLWSIEKAENAILYIAKPLSIIYKVMYPFVWLLNHAARLVARVFGVKDIAIKGNALTEEELRYIISESFKSGEINQAEYKFVNNIFEFDERIAKEIMVPRPEIVSLDINDTLADFLNIARRERFTRYPVTDGDKDHIVGLVNVKEILTAVALSKKDPSEISIRSFVRPIIRAIDTIPIGDLLVKMQKAQIHMAILMDEYGGTSGLVTVEDIVEEIVGEIRDEFDHDEVPTIQHIGENHYIFDSKVLISDVNELLSLDIEEDVVDTLGGWLLTQKFDARQGDTIIYGPYEFTILEMIDYHIESIEVKRRSEEPEEKQQSILFKKTESFQDRTGQAPIANH